ncbi:hypothetical protein B0O99DRAFT_678124 [Bisporella sp. PMI_857]|nr:hypothetical protein B0O99DRAFT_678124 [Bisporella sp. PMI_857]
MPQSTYLTENSKIEEEKRVIILKVGLQALGYYIDHTQHHPRLPINWLARRFRMPACFGMVVGQMASGRFSFQARNGFEESYAITLIGWGVGNSPVLGILTKDIHPMMVSCLTAVEFGHDRNTFRASNDSDLAAASNSKGKVYCRDGSQG